LPTEEVFYIVRTHEIIYKITPSGNKMSLLKKKVGINWFSLLDQSIALTIALERSCGELRLADFDTLELVILNRIKSWSLDLGVEKVSLQLCRFLKLEILTSNLHSIERAFLKVIH